MAEINRVDDVIEALPLSAQQEDYRAEELQLNLHHLDGRDLSLAAKAPINMGRQRKLMCDFSEV